MEHSSFFDAELQRRLAQLEKRLGAYINRPDEENVHDIRTSLRRFDSMFFLLPKKQRKSNGKRIANYSRFFKVNSSVRDCDIMAARLAALSPEAKPLVFQLQRKRNVLLKSAIASAKALRKARRIRITGTSSEELQARADKVVRKLSGRIKANLALATSDRNNVEQLHSLRKDCKKLRYTLESVENAAGINRMTRAFAAISQLEDLQNMLGDIHDSDITLEYLVSSSAGVAKTLHESELAKRELLYDNFVRYVSSTLPVDDE